MKIIFKLSDIRFANILNRQILIDIYLSYLHLLYQEFLLQDIELELTLHMPQCLLYKFIWHLISDSRDIYRYIGTYVFTRKETMKLLIDFMIISV